MQTQQLPPDQDILAEKHKMPIDYTPISGVPKQGELVAGHMTKFKHVPDNIRPKTTFADKPLQVNFSEYLTELSKSRSGSS